MLRALLVILFLGTGCPELETSTISSVCTKQFEKCKLPTGPLGVCDSIACPKGQTPPCLKCISQH